MSQVENRIALIAGATGAVGGRLLQRLLAEPRYAGVTAVSRRPLELADPKLRVEIIDFDRLADWANANPGLAGADDVYCCLGTTIKKAGSQDAFQRVDHDYIVALAQAAEKHGAGQFLLVSAVGADADSRVFYSRTKGRTEDAVRACGFDALHIFRPSLLLAEREESRPSEALGQAAAPLLKPLLFGPLSRYKPITADAVARAMLNTALHGSGGAHVYEYEAIAAAC